MNRMNGKIYAVVVAAAFVMSSWGFASVAAAQEPASPSAAATQAKTAKKKTAAPAVVHPAIGVETSFGDGLSIKLVDKLQNFSSQYKRPRDKDIYSPKSVNIHPSGKKFYVNSLEGAKTVVYSLPDLKKLKVIDHKFDDSHAGLWAPSSGLFKFRHYSKNLNRFTGKPVESAFSHNARYLWVPYYRRSFDLNAQDPSALAVIDTKTDSIVRIMEAGVLPKMIALSPDGKVMAVAHWGDNTVGLIDVSSVNPKDWKYIANVAVGRQLFHNFSLTTPVDRDSNTGEALRGTVFTPNGKYLLVGCMGGGGGIAVIDVKNRKYLGKITGCMPNLRHLVIDGKWLYASINAAGYVQRMSLSKINEAIASLGQKKSVALSGWQNAKVGSGARTIVVSPKGDYIFAACNGGSSINIVDSTMRKVGEIPVDSYPVGLDISPDGCWLISTSQGRKGGGGNCVDVFRLKGLKKSNP
ncbi:MAG: YncE family protein [Muribaculaceae bacterium]|nr:YncE family protein [Muribaculaceae bacterium]